jgi:hypothetical protein
MVNLHDFNMGFIDIGIHDLLNNNHRLSISAEYL